jgi:glycosyltransferase involved in cell wall biosynthesis
MVSVIVPVYNVKQYLPACIESVLKQTYSDWELLLVDDGSTDGSAQVCDEYARQDSRICVFHKENGGVCSARNLAIDNMTGEFCIMLDSDDLIHPLLLEKTLEIMHETQADAVIYGYEKVADGFTLEQCRQQNETSQSEILSNNAVISEILIGRRFRMLSCNKLYKKDLFVNGGVFVTPLGESLGTIQVSLTDLCAAVTRWHILLPNTTP